MKFNHARAATESIAKAIGRVLPPLPATTVIVPIPTALARARQRGFDHAKLIAKHVARIRGLEYRDNLRRIGATRQVGANKQQRLIQLKDAYRVAGRSLPRRVLLIDDVYTTGATVQAAARTLQTAGVPVIYAAVFAYRP